MFFGLLLLYDAIDQLKDGTNLAEKESFAIENMHGVNGHKSPSLFIEINRENHKTTKPTTFAMVIALRCASSFSVLLCHLNGLCVWSLIESQHKI